MHENAHEHKLSTCEHMWMNTISLGMDVSVSVRVVGLAGLLQQHSLPMPYTALSVGG